MSINNHLGREISRRDDMEALLYMAVYLRNGQLPWRDLQGGPLEKNRQTGELPLKDVHSHLISYLLPLQLR